MKFDSEAVEAILSWTEERAEGAEAAGLVNMAGAFHAFKLMFADAANEDGIAFDGAIFGIEFGVGDA